MNLYPIKVRFTRTPRKGTLKGLRIPQSLGFPDRHSAELWISGAKRNTPEITEITLQPA